MDSPKATAAGAVPPPNGRKHHKPSSSLGSLYEVLADLDENQLEYLLQEMNHTGHQNVKVSQAVSAFDSQSPPESLSAIRASMLPSPAPELQRQTSKSQQGKLRLQTAFQRAPSLKQRPQTDFRASLKPAQTASPKRDNLPSRQPSPPVPSPVQNGTTTLPPPSPEIVLPKRGTTTGTTATPSTASARRPTASSTRTTSAYKRISRPDFNLPPGITVPDLLQLLETEFLSSTSPETSSPISTSPASTSPFPGRISPSPSIALSPSPAPSGRRTLRKHSSRLDMALEAERNASGIEEIGLGMLEPRGSPGAAASLRRASAASLRRTSAASLRGSAPGTPVEVFGRGFARAETPPVVMEGIFDVLENR